MKRSSITFLGLFSLLSFLYFNGFADMDPIWIRKDGTA